MENNDLLRRLQDLYERCERQSVITSTNFLTPAEAYKARSWADKTGARAVLFGGYEGAERAMVFFLPEWMEDSEPDYSEYISAIELTAYFGAPGHRDYMGALLGMGIGREWLGDISVCESKAYVFCAHSVEKHLLSVDKVGRFTVRAKPVELSEVPAPKREVRSVSFSVMSPRLDAVTAGMFNLSRTEAAKLIEAGAVSLNYTETVKTDKPVGEGDIISLRGAGKGRLTGTGGTSRKGRLFVYADIYI